MVYVLDHYGHPLMPTNRHGRVRNLLERKEAKIVNYNPFTIQLLYESTTYTQEVSLGVDAGSKHIGLSATTKKKELYASEVALRSDIVELLAMRRESRRTRRNRLRYRKARFNNRVHAKKEGWLPPSIQQKVGTQLAVIEKVHQILPISKIIIEAATFDIHKIKNPDIQGAEYQQGEQLDFWNVREYVLTRDNYTCQCCKGRTKVKVLEVHHIESRKTGGNAPNNLVTLCKTCHEGYHEGFVALPKTIRRGTSLRDAAYMNMTRWAVYHALQERYADVSVTYGYITKHTRIENGLPKSHCIDARCISGTPLAKPLGYYFFQKKVRCHNRQIHKANFIKGHRKKNNQTEYLVRGFRLFDKVRYQKKDYFIFGRRKSGFFDIRDLHGNKVNNGSISYKKLQLLETRNFYLTERRSVVAAS